MLQHGGRGHPLALLLAPLGAIYHWAGQHRLANTTPVTVGVPVICIGNVTLGGVGKTPFALHVAELLQSAGEKPAFLSRGYGGSARGPVLVSKEMTVAESGDEPQLLARRAPVCIAADRVAGAQLIEQSGAASVIIMDDGFQNPALSKDLSFILVDAAAGFGNGRVFPAGPLRETPDTGRSRAQAVVVVTAGPDAAIPARLRAFAGDLPLFQAWLEAPPLDDAPRRAVAFCGIGRPEKFYQSARHAGYDLLTTHDFPDHHPFSEKELIALQNEAASLEAVLVTTEKDHVRLPASFQHSVETLPVTMRVDKHDELKSLLLAAVGQAAAR